MLEVVGQTKANVGKSSKEDNEAYNGFKKTLKIALSGRRLLKARHTSPILGRGLILVCNKFGFPYYSLFDSPGLSPSEILILHRDISYLLTFNIRKKVLIYYG